MTKRVSQYESPPAKSFWRKFPSSVICVTALDDDYCRPMRFKIATKRGSERMASHLGSTFRLR